MNDSPYRIETMKLSDFAAVSRLWRNSEGIGLNESDTKANIAIYLNRNPKMSFSALARAGITRCNIYLINSNTAGEAFWKHNGWTKIDDVQVLQKSISKDAKSGCGC